MSSVSSSKRGLCHVIRLSICRPTEIFRQEMRTLATGGSLEGTAKQQRTETLCSARHWAVSAFRVACTRYSHSRRRVAGMARVIVPCKRPVSDCGHAAAED